MLKKLDLFEKLLVLCMVITPFTLLRVGVMGIGESIIIILFLYEFNQRKLDFKLSEFIFTKFWILYLVISLFGFSFNVLFLNHKTGTFDGMLFDFSAYFLILLSCYTIESYQKRKGLNIYRILKYLFFCSSIVLTLLYILSLFSPTLLGLPLRYNKYFAPLVRNLHQISMFIIPLPFIGALIFEREKSKIIKIIIIGLVVVLFLMGIETGSFKAFIGLYLGAIIYLFLRFISLFNDKFRKPILFISFLLFLFIFLINFETISVLLTNMFHEEDVSDGRAILYTNAIKVGLSSPIVGLGTGPHILSGGNFWDAHQTFLAVFLQTGLVGIILFFNILVKVVVKIFRTPALFGALIPILVYISGGDVLRRLPIWLFLLLFYYYQPTINEEVNE